MYFTIEDLERHSLVIRTSQSVRAGATQIRVRSIPEGIVGEQIVIDVYGANPETRTVTAQDTKYLTVAALAYGHAEGVAVVRMWLFNQAIVFNEAGADVDFRFEAVGETNALFIQGSDGYVGVGKVPTVRLDVAGNIRASGDIVLDDGAGDSPSLQFIAGTNSDTARIWIRDDPVAGLSDLDIKLPGDTAGSILKISNASGFLVHYLDALGGAVFNEQDNDADFRVKSDNLSHALFVQGSDGFVGIGKVPTVRLDVAGDIVVDGGAVFNEAGADVDFRVEGDTSGNCLFVHGGSDNVSINSASVSAHYDLLLGGDGVLALAHGARPTVDGDIGKLYCKADGNLYFLTGGDIEWKLDMTLA